jgi:hypothetical protein
MKANSSTIFALDAGAADPACRSVKSTTRPGDEVSQAALNAGAQC